MWDVFFKCTLRRLKYYVLGTMIFNFKLKLETVQRHPKQVIGSLHRSTSGVQRCFAATGLSSLGETEKSGSVNWHGFGGVASRESSCRDIAATKDYNSASGTTKYWMA